MADIVISQEDPEQSLFKKLRKKFQKLFGKKLSDEMPGALHEQEAPALTVHQTEMERRLTILIERLPNKSPPISSGETSAALIERINIVYPTLNTDEQAAVRYTFFEILRRVDLDARKWVQCIFFLRKRKAHFSPDEIEALILEIESMKKRPKRGREVIDYIKMIKKMQERKRKSRKKGKIKKEKT